MRQVYLYCSDGGGGGGSNVPRSAKYYATDKIKSIFQVAELLKIWAVKPRMA